MSINLKSTQSCLDSIGFLLSLAEVALLDKKLIAVGWHHADLEGLDKWVAFNIYTSPMYTGFLYSLNSPLKIKELRHVVRDLREAVNGLFTGANDFKVLYEGVEGWQDVTLETDPNWKVIKLLPISTNETEYRCTDNDYYQHPDCDGFKDYTARQGYYIKAVNPQDALNKMLEKFPDNKHGFTVQEGDRVLVTGLRKPRNPQKTISV